MNHLNVGSKAIIVNSENHSEYNFQICEIVEIDIKRQLCFVQIIGMNFTSTVWVSFNELIPVLYEKKEDIEKYGNLEDLYKTFAHYKGYYDCICRFADGENKRADKLARENQNLQCKIDEMQKHIDCLKAEIRETEGKTVLPNQPIKVADLLIDNFVNKVQFVPAKENLKQIAEHLLVYCNAKEN